MPMMVSPVSLFCLKCVHSNTVHILFISVFLFHPSHFLYFHEPRWTCGGPRRATDIWAGLAIRAKVEQKANTWQGR